MNIFHGIIFIMITDIVIVELCVLLLVLQLLEVMWTLFISFGCRLQWSSMLLLAGFIPLYQSCLSSSLQTSCTG